MILKFTTALRKLKSLLMQEDGQNLVEYALIIALIALAATAGMRILSTDIKNAFVNIGNTLNTDI
ncbi:MAG TPA: Flp family type IVb pilin [Terracidiphilus sp.]